MPLLLECLPPPSFVIYIYKIIENENYYLYLDLLY